MGGSSSSKIKETPEQQELAKIAAEKWNFSQNTLAPLMDRYMQKTGEMKSDSALAYQRGRSNESAQANYNQQASKVSDGLNRMGVDPSSGRAVMTNTQLNTAHASTSGEHMGRAQNEQLSQHVKGLQNVTALGMGEAGEAQAGLGSIASLNAANQRQDAFNSFNRQSANLQLLGTAAGAGVGLYMNQPAAGANGYSAKGNIADGNLKSIGL